MRPDAESLLRVAVRAARAAGDRAASQTSRRRRVARCAAHDVKLALDSECQRHASAVIRAAFPRHRILGEEDHTIDLGLLEQITFARTAGEADAAVGEITWILDPIDGTVNFMHGLPHWCSSVAVARGGTIVAGAVYAQPAGTLYVARAGARSTCNGRPLRVSRTLSLARAVIATGVDRGGAGAPPPATILRAVALGAFKARLMGAAALELCYVAAGTMDGYFEASIRLWDVAAAGLIVRQAGGMCEVLGGIDREGRMRFLASNGRIHSALRRLVRPHSR